MDMLRTAYSVDFSYGNAYISHMVTGLLYEPRFLEHDTGPDHPERPERLSAVMAHLKTLPWYQDLKHVSPRTAELNWVQAVHTLDYIQRVEETCRQGQRQLDSPDVGISKNSYEIALLACGGALQMADEIIAGNIQNGFGLLRPPGHHAETEQAMGFCLFNNIAITAKYLQTKHRLNKILILDWDVHHGNGTQHTFEEDPSVLYVSLHEYPFYPGTGSAGEAGIGRGQGATLNFPMPAGSGDMDYQVIFTDEILPKLHEFKPEVILISAGFDAHNKDPLADIRLTAGCYGWMTARLMEIAERYSGGRIISLLEGGYHLEALSLSVEQHLLSLSGNQIYDDI